MLTHHWFLLDRIAQAQSLLLGESDELNDGELGRLLRLASVYLPSTLPQLKHQRQSAEQPVAITIANERDSREAPFDFI